ncbi:hypothetical protein D9Q98_002363 [Chlorella vulgaris]|uniref:Uncharacterized protein n=1 Tax=Chlorella vulgaris TaxID=3077 RepID=A0A9D4TWQ2_CHLVU|nr:hypothetical protein D9Q98_002363 [Chlorella vulgaris]
MQLAACLAARLCFLLTALWLLQHRQLLASAAGRGGSQLARFVHAQLLWFMSAQPAGVKLHRHTAELLSLCGLQYASAVQRLLSGWAPLLTNCATGLWAAACVGGGPRQGLLAVECLLWGAGLLVAVPYAALAALYRGQLHATALMWRSMRGKQRLPLLRLKLHGMLRGAGSSSIPGGLASHGSHQHRTAGPDAGITGLKQLSGSMLLFMPLLLLLPTTAWFYVAALALHTACSLLRAAVHFTLQLLTGPTCDSSSGSCTTAPERQKLESVRTGGGSSLV